MNLTDWANLSTAAGSLLSGISIFAGFYLYQKTKQDEFSSSVRKKLINIREACHDLNRLVTYELAHEVSETVVFSPSITYALNKLVNDIRDKDISDEELERYVKDNFPAVTPSVNSALIEKIENIISIVKSDIGELRITFPGLYRVVSPILSVLSIIVGHHKQITRNDDLWRKVLPEILRKEKDKSVEDIQHILQRIFLAICHKRVTEHDQDDIDDLLSALDLTLDAYLEKSNKELADISRKERRVKFTPTSQTKRISDNLREAEKALGYVLTSEEEKTYRELVVKFEQRNSSKENR